MFQTTNQITFYTISGRYQVQVIRWKHVEIFHDISRNDSHLQPFVAFMGAAPTFHELVIGWYLEACHLGTLKSQLRCPPTQKPAAATQKLQPKVQQLCPTLSCCSMSSPTWWSTTWLEEGKELIPGFHDTSSTKMSLRPWNLRKIYWIDIYIYIILYIYIYLNSIWFLIS